MRAMEATFRVRRRRRCRRTPRIAALLTILAVGAVACVGASETPPAAVPSPSARATGEPATVPLVFVAHPRRSPIDLRRAVAGAILAGRDLDWSALGQAPGAVRLVRGRSAPGAAERVADADAVRLVERDPSALAVVSAHAVGPTVRVLTVAGSDPLTEADSYPYRTPGQRRGPVTTLIGVGDVMMGGRVGTLLRSRGDYGAPLRHVRARLAEADITLGTLESTLSRAGSPRQPPGENFAADPRILPALRRAGFDVLSVGNNHVGDFGPRALVDTVRRLKKAGIRPVGAGANDAEARRPAVVERAGVRFGFYAFNARGETPRATSDRPGAVRLRMAPYDAFSQEDLASIVRDVRGLARRVDVVIALPHWGRQYTHIQNADQRRVARALVDAGADAVVGSHPHWVQGVEMRGDGFVAYSLGNFVFSQRVHLPQTRQSVSVELTFWGSDLKRAELLPGRIESDFAARFLPWNEGREILEDVWRNSARPFRLTPSHSGGPGR